MKSTFLSLTRKKLDQCQSNYKKNYYKVAIINCRDVLKIQPNNEQALSLIQEMTASLTQKAKERFGDAVVEEGMMNIDQAKKIWKEVLEIDIPNGEYYKKAKQKLLRFPAQE